MQNNFSLWALMTIRVALLSLVLKRWYFDVETRLRIDVRSFETKYARHWRTLKPVLRSRTCHAATSTRIIPSQSGGFFAGSGANAGAD
jgi:hypothetical protein